MQAVSISRLCWPRWFAITVLSRWYNNCWAWRNVYFLYLVASRASTVRLVFVRLGITMYSIAIPNHAYSAQR